MRRLFRLPVLALGVWIALAGLLSVLALMVVAGSWHPHFLPVTALLALLIVSGSMLVAGGAWRVIRGPGRLRAMTCLVLGGAPLLFCAGYGLYGFKAGFGRQIELGLPLKMLIPLSESVFDLLTRFRYPVRTAGETVIMISTPVANAREQVAAMDRHVRSLWNRLGGKTTRRRVHWVRGPLLGISGKAINGMCLASVPGESPADADGLTSFDRHEVAHCVLSSFLPLDIDPPAVLSEGWAHANMGRDSQAVALEARELREQGRSLSLRELTGPVWYCRHQLPAYVQGGALVNHILGVYGPAKFLDLYTTCRPSTFAADCRRVLGVSLDQLGADYWSKIDQTAEPGSSALARLRRMKVQPPVSTDAWSGFLDEYTVKLPTLAAPFEHVRMTYEWHFDYPDEHGQRVHSSHRTVVLRSGDKAALHVTTPDVEEAWLATPGRSFEASRKQGADVWEVRDTPVPAAAAYKRALRRIEENDRVSSEAALLLAISEELENFGDTPGIVVTQLERSDAEGLPRVRVRLEDQAVRPFQWRSVTIVMAVDSLAAQSMEVGLRDGSTLCSELTYENVAGQSVLSGIQSRAEDQGVTTPTSGMKILERTFGPVPDAEFSESKLLDGPVVSEPARSDAEVYKDPVTFADWYWVPLFAGGIAFGCGLVSGVLGGLRNRRPIPPERGATSPEGRF